MTQNIGRKRTKTGFTQISNELIENESLSAKSKWILIYLLSRPNNWRFNKKDIQNRATEGRDSIQSGINELKEHGYLHIYQSKAENGVFDGWIWEYSDIPFEIEHPTMSADNPHETGEIVQIPRRTEKPYDGKTVLRKTRAYNNTDLNNTDLNNTEYKEINKNIRSNSSEFESKLIEERALPKNGTPSKKLSSSQLESEFEQIWAIYPKKIGKKKAFDSFKKARNDKKISYEEIENGLYKYVKHLQTEETEAQYIMHGSTWFNQEKWQDEYITHAPKRKPRNMMEYVRQKRAGGFTHESRGNREVSDLSESAFPEF